MGHEDRMGKITMHKNILVGKSEERDNLENVGMYGRILFK
jgi:hypothetical protein